MIDWVVIGGYLIGVVIGARLIAPHFLDGMADGSPDTEDIIMSRVFALLAAAAWPFVVLGVIVMWKTPKSRGQLKRERDEAQARIRELEREMGIGDQR